MNDPILNRRDLNRLTLAALGGLAAGLLPGCGPCGNGPPPSSAPSDQAKGGDDIPLLLHDPHVCRGINTCKDKGKQGTTNDCAGQGHCATVASHSCQGSNDCKGHGGCGDHPGENDCNGKGECAVPLDAVRKMTWQKARKHFEELMPKAFPDKKVGPAPES
jgi:hypothetical protein